MRSFIAFALVLAACGGDDRSSIPATRTASSASSQRGPDALLLRVPRAGGVGRVTAYPNIDSTVWNATDAAPPLDRVLAFDPDAGLIAALDFRGLPVWIDLRVGTVTLPHLRGGLHGITSVDGSSIFAVGDDGAVVRFTPTGTWLFKPPAPARAVFPQSGGILLILGGGRTTARLWRMHPPSNRILDSLTLPETVTGTGAGSPLADRVYVETSDRTLLGVHARRLAVTRSIEFGHRVIDIAATPSGDRFYVITDSSNRVNVVDQYQDRQTGTIELAGRPRDLRIDPFGRFLLVRAATGDEVWVVGVGTDQVVGTVHSVWRGDVPFVAPDGAIAVSNARDVAFLDPSTFKETRRSPGGASEFWYAFLWNGLRARAATLDQPVEFPTDSPATALPPAARPRDTVAAPPPPPQRVDSSKIGFLVSFAAVLNETAAKEQASKIVVEGHAARVVTGTTSGVTVYRVVLGPYATRAEADRVGRTSGLSYYVMAGTP
ncbi:MAG TPA: SPOR domain-containing protein [Acidimicrobiia bacterium]|nr:SPOR domain-containing protein [Acidimicrobiia bacterium]